MKPQEFYLKNIIPRISHIAYRGLIKNKSFPFFSLARSGRPRSGPVHLSVRCPLPVSPGPGLPRHHRVMRLVEANHAQPAHHHDRQEHHPRHHRAIRSSGRHLQRHGSHHRRVLTLSWTHSLCTSNCWIRNSRETFSFFNVFSTFYLFLLVFC